MLMECSSRSAVEDGPMSPKYSDRLSPAINHYLSEASRQEVRVSFPFQLIILVYEYTTHMPPKLWPEFQNAP